MKAIKAAVHLDTRSHAGEIDRRIFSGFLEHLGRAVYGGVYEPGSRLSDKNGFRVDVLKAVRELRQPLVRYPGGSFASSYDWRDGVGPRKSRPVRPDPAWKSRESNAFGTDEFLAWCGAAGSAGMLTLNLGTLGPKEAAELLEYCNFPAGTHWSDRRAANGRPAPYGVKVWCLGNELDDPSQIGHLSAERYAERARQAAHLMRRIDPSIELVACGTCTRENGPYLEWDRKVLEECWDEIDYIAPHRYSENRRDDSAWYLADGVELDALLADYACLLDSVGGAKESGRKVRVAFDEWNVWYRSDRSDGGWASAPPLLEETYNLEDALVCAQTLNAFIRRADLVKIACLAQLVNALAPVMTRADGVLLQTIYHPFRLISTLARGRSLSPRVDGPLYAAGARGEVPALDVSACHDTERGEAAVFLVNRAAGTEAAVDIRFEDAAVSRALSVDLLTGPDLKAANTWDEPRKVEPQPGRVAVRDGAASLTLPGAGFAAVRLQLQ